MESVRREMTWSQKFSVALHCLSARMSGYPTLVNLEVTRRCNARCDFCRYWSSPAEQPIADYVPVIRRLRPSVVIITGGEPLLRRDILAVVGGIRTAFPAIYLGLVTNGWLLSLEKGLALWNAGVSQITVSLDFLDQRHEAARGIPGLTKRIVETVPRLAAAGVNNLVVQTVIKSDNLDAIEPIIAWVRASGVKLSLSAYTDAKNGNDSHNISGRDVSAVRRITEIAAAAKRSGVPIVSSSYYLGRIAEFFDKGGIDGCTSGRRFVTVTPSGFVSRCSESEERCHYTEWTPFRFRQTHCTACWVPCRGESQAPVNLERLRQIAALYGATRRHTPTERETAAAIC